MVELGVRFAAAIGVVVVSWILRVPNLDFAWKWSLAVAAYAVFVAILEHRNLKSRHSAELLAVADAAAISLLLAVSGVSAQFAFLAVAPVAYAVTAKGAQPSVAAPICTGGVIASEILVGKGELGPAFLAQCGAILAIGLILRPPRVEVMDIDELATVDAPPATTEVDVDLRERFRQLKSYARELEHRVGRDKWVHLLFEAKQGREGRLTERLSRVLKDHSGAEGVSIHLLSDSRFVFAAAFGKLAAAVRQAAFDLNPNKSDGEIQERFRRALGALAGDEERLASRCVLLKSGKRLIGMVTVHHSRMDAIESVSNRIELAAPIVAALVDDERDRAQIRRRLKEIEVLYDIASLVAGADGPENVLRRTVRELSSEWDVDHLAAFKIGPDQLEILEEHGASLRLIESMSFAAGPGLQGWIGLGLPELFLPDAADDQRVPDREAVKRRIGSFLAVSLADRYVITVATHHTFGIAVSMVETLRLIAAELDAAIARLESPGGSTGLTHPTEFFAAVGRLGAGWLCYLEPIHRSDLLETFGKPAFDRALRQLSPKLRSVLPPGGLICRRDEGDFVAFLPTADEETAQGYLREATTAAAMVPIRTPDGKRKIPLALRGRIAAMERGERAIA